MDEEALKRLSDAVFRAHDPRTRALDAFAQAVSNVCRVAESVDEAFTESARRPGGNPALALRLADTTARHRELMARVRDKYGDPEALYDRLGPRGGMSARVWS